jgi:hypothetical protein
MAREAMRREVDHEALRAHERNVRGEQHRDTTRSSCGGVCAIGSRATRRQAAAF